MSDATAWLQQHADWPLVHDFFSDFAGPLGWWILLQLVILLAGTQRGLRLAWFVGAAALSNTLLKWLWAEPRPYWTSDSISALRATAGFGMPSGHAQGATAVWLGLWLALGKQSRGLGLALLAVVFVVFTGISRIYYGVHSVPQVLVGVGIGLALTLAMARVLPSAELALQRTSWPGRAGFAAGVLALATALTWVVFSLRADFAAPLAWQERFEATQLRTGASAELGEMGLVEGGSFLLLMLLAGYALLAMVATERGHRIAVGYGRQFLCVLAAIGINLAAITGLRAIDAGTELVGLWLLVQPVIALWLPLKLFGANVYD